MIETKIHPINDYLLLVKEDDKEEVTASGIFVASSDDKKQFHGIYARVIRIGPKVKNKKIKVGARLVVNRYDLLDIREGAKTFGILRGEELVSAICDD